MKILHLGVDGPTRQYLEPKGFAFTTAMNVKDVTDLVNLFELNSYDLLLINLSTKSWGTYTPRSIRKMGHDKIPIIGIASASTDTSWSELRTNFLESGGDDLMQHPVNPNELAAVIRSVTRRYRATKLESAFTFKCGNNVLTFDRVTQRAFVNEIELILANREISILEYLSMHSGRYVTKEQIASSVYGNSDFRPVDEVVESHISKLKSKIRVHIPDVDRLLITKRFTGYKLESVPEGGK